MERTNFEEAECPECGTRCYVERHKLHVHYDPIRPRPASLDLRAALIRAVAGLDGYEHPDTTPGGWWDRRIEPVVAALAAEYAAEEGAT